MASRLLLDDGVSFLLLDDGASTLVLEYAAIALLLSANIADGGVTATTAQLTAPSGKTSGANFHAGVISDDTNPLSVSLGADTYTEHEFSLRLADDTITSDQYEFRVTNAGVALDAYPATLPFVTVASSAVSLIAKSVRVLQATNRAATY